MNHRHRTLLKRSLLIAATGSLLVAFNNCGGFQVAELPGSSSSRSISSAPTGGQDAAVPLFSAFSPTLSQLCLDLDDAGHLVQTTCSGASAQRIEIKDDGAGHFKLRLRDQCVEAGALGASVLGQTCTDGAAQVWNFGRAGDGVFVIRNAGSAGCLSVQDGGLKVGARVSTAACAAGRTQIFKIAGYVKPPTPRILLNGVAPMLVGQDKHPAGVDAFELAIGKGMDFAVEFGGARDWADYKGDIGWASGIWRSVAPDRVVMWSIPLTVGPGCVNCGTTLKAVAAGANDADITAAAKALALNAPRAMIRLGWEFNGGWYPWGAKGVTTDYINAFRHVVALYRAQSPDFKFVWCTNLGRNDFDPDLAYPGDDVVDIVGMDVYDFNYSNQDMPTRWDSVLNQDFGLRWQVAFADLHRKTLAIPEWGAGANGDNPLFVTNMMKWMKSNQYAYQSWWEGEAGSGYDSALGKGKFPLEAAALKANF